MILFPCDICGERFSDISEKRLHHMREHSHRYTLASERPIHRGDVPCGVAGCEQTFGTEHAAKQHRRAKHGL